ncbi:MAG: beta-glucuronidase [Oscillospiraceae bacterium]|nr:beta-glucuronidase [Oscillospiraceae bacterium]
MSTGISAGGSWALCLDPAPCQYQSPPAAYPLTMLLPGTTAQQEIGEYNSHRATGTLSEKYPFEGQIWLKKTFSLSADQVGKPCFLHLERTRITRLWVNGVFVGTENSLCTPHIYDLSAHTAEQMEIVLCVANIGYPTRGGHMTSPDTQTNWIGIIGRMKLEFHADTWLSDVQIYPNCEYNTAVIEGVLHGAAEIVADIVLKDQERSTLNLSWRLTLHANAEGAFSVTIPFLEPLPLWDEYHQNLYDLVISLQDGDHAAVTFGLRNFCACGNHFEVNGNTVLLRGKHDAMLFPLTGAAPADEEDWTDIFLTAKKWGINHYRFHTCCPPEAAFIAADEAGIYLEPELPFWGTIHGADDPQYHAEEQAYLLREGLRICRAFGNHPSFCMFSLGNELWGDTNTIGAMIDTLRNADSRMLYTQGSNNYQHMPLQLPQDDFWVGVRTGIGKRLRGSYAECDAPLGKIQVSAPSASWNYEAELNGKAVSDGMASFSHDVQVGQNTMHVEQQTTQKGFVPSVPVITHEIGQYNMCPDYSEIEKYTGVLEARNFEVFYERLEQAGMAHQARAFFECSGALARDCYKMELEAVMRSPGIAGFQLLDLQDYTGQGTALVGMLNAFMENKGFITPEAWRGFCGDLVPLAQFDSFVVEAGKTFLTTLGIRVSRPHIEKQKMLVSLQIGATSFNGEVEIPECSGGYHRICTVGYAIPESAIGNGVLTLSLPMENIKNTWKLTFMPPVSSCENEVCVVHCFSEAEPYLRAGQAVLLLPDRVTDAVESCYCTDFWNYSMFKSISESLGKKVPVGTMGLCIQKSHPIAKAMFSECYSTPQWFEPVSNGTCVVLDHTPGDYQPIVQVIDNVTRNHKLGLLFEADVLGGKLLVCAMRFDRNPFDISQNRLKHAVYDYMNSSAFAPSQQLPAEYLRTLFG